MTPVPPEHEAAAFISYSREDSEFALRLARDLKAAGAEIWLDQLDIHPGHEWDDAIEAALVAAPLMLLILSPASASSRNVRNEVAVALDEGKKIIPILHRDCVVPLQLRRIQYVDFRTDYARGFAELLRHMGVGPAGLPETAADGPVQHAPPGAQETVKAGPAIAPKGQQHAAAKEHLPPPAALPLMQRLGKLWPVLPLVGILLALMFSDLGDFMGHLPFASNPCALIDVNQTSFSAKMYLPLATWALRYTPTPSVALIYIDPQHDPPDLLTNVCASRVFLGRLVGDLNTLGAHVIVIDKYYSAGACAEADKNAGFIQAMEASKVPVVVGEHTYGLPDGSKSAGCLALPPRLEFSPASKVRYGLIRLDTDHLKIPLRWPVFSAPAAGAGAQTGAQSPTQLPAASGDTLALTAAKAVSPDLESNPTVQKLLAAGDNPYTTFLNLPHITALTALCSAEPAPRAVIDGQPGDALCQPWTHPLDNLDGNQLSLNGKIVVIGDLSDADMQAFPTDLAPFPPGKRPGVFLQANYVQALLDHRFLLEMPMAATLGLLVVYVLVVYCLYRMTDKDGGPRLSVVQAGLVSLAVLACMVFICFLALMSMSYFTPLWALWGAAVFMVFCYLDARRRDRSRPLAGQPHAPGHAQNDPAGVKHG